MRIVWMALATLTLAAGCSLTDSHVKQMDVLNGMAVQAQQSLASGAMTSVQASGQGINPGVTVEAAIVYRATARYEGLAGQFMIAQQGVSTTLPAGEADTVNRIYRDKAARSDETRGAAIDIAKHATGTPANQQAEPIPRIETWQPGGAQ